MKRGDSLYTWYVKSRNVHATCILHTEENEFQYYSDEIWNIICHTYIQNNFPIVLLKRRKKNVFLSIYFYRSDVEFYKRIYRQKRYCKINIFCNKIEPERAQNLKILTHKKPRFLAMVNNDDKLHSDNTEWKHCRAFIQILEEKNTAMQFQ